MAQPQDVILFLRRMAANIDAADHPSKSRVSADLFRLILATDRTLALKVQEVMINEIVKLFPTEFKKETWDTSTGGKGFLSGYVSFGMDPMSWDSVGIIGGILFNFRYSGFKSMEPEPIGNWAGRGDGGDVVKFEGRAGYYHKKGGATYDEMAVQSIGLSNIDIGEVHISFDDFEKIVDVQVNNPGKFTSGVKGLIDSILKNPPDFAQSSGYKKKKTRSAPNYSPQALLKDLIDNNRSDVKQSEIDAVARTVSAKSGSSFFMEQQKTMDFFKNRGWAIDRSS